MKKSKNKKNIVAVLGAGNMGTAVAQVLADNGHEVRIWNWEGDSEPLKQIEKFGENKKYLKGIKLSQNIIPQSKIDDALIDAQFVFLVIPSSVLEHTISFAARSIHSNAIVVDVSKGLCPKTMQITPYIIAKHLHPRLRKNITAISGPAVAIQMVSKNFTAMNVASKNVKAIKKVQEVMENDYIKLVPSKDIIGVQVGGSFKNVYSIAIGMCEGMGFGLNTKAAVITYALAEMADLMKALGGNRKTAYELAGIGDLIGTSLCADSRNHRFGKYLGQGFSVAESKKKVQQTIEGIDAAKVLVTLARKHHISTPFASTVYHCVSSKQDPRRALINLLKNIK